MADNSNPGNFANRPKEEVQEIAKKGGQASHSGGFASMDPDKQVSSIFHLLRNLIHILLTTKCSARLRLKVAKHPAVLSNPAARKQGRRDERVDLLVEDLILMIPK
jgi:hypothetical protein